MAKTKSLGPRQVLQVGQLLNTAKSVDVAERAFREQLTTMLQLTTKLLVWFDEGEQE